MDEQKVPTEEKKKCCCCSATLGVLVIVLAGLLCGCMTLGRPINDKLTQIKEGVTTKQEVIQLLGAPRRVLSTDGEEVFQYRSRKIQIATLGYGNQEENAAISFDKNGIAKKVRYSKEQDNHI